MRNFREYLLEKLNEPSEAISYLNTATEEYETGHDSEAFLLSLRTVTEARGGNPRLNTLEAVLYDLGFRLAIVPLRERI